MFVKNDNPGHDIHQLFPGDKYELLYDLPVFSGVFLKGTIFIVTPDICGSEYILEDENQDRMFVFGLDSFKFRRV